VNRTVQSSSQATPSLDTVATKEVAAWAKPRPQRSKPADIPFKPSDRRRSVARTTSQREHLAAEQEFMTAMQEYKAKSGRMFPTWSEVLEVLQSLGYQKGI
jgi:hypothetical protein